MAADRAPAARGDVSTYASPEARAAAGRPASAVRAATREAIAHAFLAEYHRLLSDALADALAAGDVRADSGGDLADGRRRAFAWRVTAVRIPLVPDRCWPTWLLDHLRVAAETPVLGPEYGRQRQLLVELLEAGGAAGHVRQ